MHKKTHWQQSLHSIKLSFAHWQAWKLLSIPYRSFIPVGSNESEDIQLLLRVTITVCTV